MAPAPSGRVATGRACITPLGHATALIELGGVAILTDPVLSSAVGPRVGGVIVGPRRRLPPARELSELPAIDLVLVSHAHWDHADAATLARLPQSAAACVHRRNRDLVRRFADVRELGWGEATDLDGAERSRLRVTAIPSRHWGARMLVDHWRGYGGFLVEALDVESPRWPGQPLSVVFAGDTAMTDAYKELRARRGVGVDVALMPIGAYDPWIMNHCSPEQAWRMGVEHLEADRLVPIHYDTFRLSNEPVGDPLRRLREAAESAGEPDRLGATAYGERLVIA